jgi:hypothetical protein
MQLSRRAPQLVTFALLTSAATAYAECGWVLWTTATPPPGVMSLTPVILSSYGSMSECVREIDIYDKGTQWAQKVPARFSPTRLVTPYEGREGGGFREYLCLPDTVDPRGPKGK